MDLLPFVCVVCQELERELELQVGLKQEMEVAMKLLEKDTHEKQDTLAALRLQLDQVKTLNLQMFHKAQVCAACAPGRHAAFSCIHRQTQVNAAAAAAAAAGLRAGGREKTSQGRAAGEEDGGNGEGHGGDGAKVRTRSKSMCN